MRTSKLFAKLATAALVASLVVPALPAVAADDTTPPVVTNLAPLTIYRNVPTTFSAHYTDNSAGVASCTLLINSFIQGEGAMSLSVPTGNAGDASQSYTYTGSLSTITARVRCADQAPTPNTGTTGYVDVTVLDSASIGAPSPTTATAGSVTNFSATITDASGLYNTCGMYIGAFNFTSLTRSGSSLTGTYTFATPDTYSVHAECAKSTDPSQKVSSATVTLTVSAAGGGSSASMGTLTPTTATAGSATAFSTTISDPSVKWFVCALYVNGASVATMTRSGSSVTGSYTFPAAGNYSTYARCQLNDTPPDPVVTPTITVAVSTTGGSVSMGSVSPSSVAVGLSTVFSATITDASGLYNTCSLGVGGALVATLTRSGSSVSGNYTFVSPGSYNVYASCWKSTDPTQTVQSLPVTVTATSGGGADISPPSVAITAPVGTVVAGTSVVVSANYTDNVGVANCLLSVNGVTQGNMTFISGTAATGVVTRSHTFSTVGDVLVSVYCGDAVGNAHTDNEYVTVAAAGTPPPPPAPTSTDTDSDGLLNTEEATLGTSSSNRDTDGDQLSDYEEVRVYHSDPLRRDTDGDGYNDGEEVRNGYNPNGPGNLSGTTPTAGTLIKMPCPVGAGVNHTCKAVYFYGRDGKRHPFPHEKTYFSWYPNFGSVQNVSESAMSRLPLGTNVTYRPGVRLVKFQTLNTVYAATRGGVLRALASESVAVAVYGTAWNRQVDDIGDAFFSNYTFGADITQANQYVPLAETAAVLSIDDNF